MRAHSMLMVMLAGVFLAACDSNANDEMLMGGWVRMRTPTEVRDRYVFGADGSFQFDENKPGDPDNEDHLVGTYIAEGDVVTATVSDAATGQQGRLTFSYYANKTQFSSAALRAAAGHNGFVGVWTGTRKIELTDGSEGPSGADVQVDVRADGSYRLTRTPVDGTAPAVEAGTWHAEDDATVRFATASGFGHTLALLDDEALVDQSVIWQRKTNGI